MNDAFLMGVLDGLADWNEQFKALANVEVVLIAVVGDRNTLDQFHHKIGTAARRCAGIEHFGDVCMIHDRQRLTILLETCDDTSRVQSQLDYFEANAARDGLLLFGQPNGAESAFAKALEQAIRA